MKCFVVGFVGVVALLLFSACSEPEDSTPVLEPVEVAAPVSKTSGQVNFDGIPDKGLVMRELIIVSKLDADVRRQLQRQRELFELKLRGEVSSYGEWESSERCKNLLAKWREAIDRYPKPLVLDVDLGNNRLRKYQSSQALYSEYKPLFTALNFSNLERGIQFIEKQIGEDMVPLNVLLESDNLDDQHIATVTKQWLKQVHELLATVTELGNEYFSQQAAFAKEADAFMSEPQTWEGYAQRYAMTMVVGISKNSLGSVELGVDGRFKAAGQGEIIVRLEYAGALSAYIFPQDPEEKRAWVTDLREYSEME